MTGSSEPDAAQSKREPPLGARWRAESEAVQERALAPGSTVVSCPAPFGAGGLGRHLKELADASIRRAEPAICLCGEALAHSSADESPFHHQLHLRNPPTPLRRLMRLSPSWRSRRHSVAFDRAATRHLPAAKHLLAFNGQALKQFEAAKRAKYESVSLVAANPHLRVLMRRHEQAYRQYPLERSWATQLVERNMKEYTRAQRILVASRYTWESFVEEGLPERSLSVFPLTPDPRFAFHTAPSATTTFDVVFVGRLCVTKGVPLLVDAVRALPHDDLRLILIGGWGSRGMRRFLQEACSRDRRITMGPGDPLPHLRRAALFVHPAYEDGFAYAPAEALACGLPVLVSEDTGMKDLIEEGVTGMTLPTGDLQALTEAIHACYLGEILTR